MSTRKKKSTVQELKEMIEKRAEAVKPTEKTEYTITKDQFDTLRKVAMELTEIRRELEDLEDQRNKSVIMFRVGVICNKIDRCEDNTNEIVDTLRFEDDEDVVW